MKAILIIIVLVLAGIVGVAPGYVGQRTETEIRDGLPRLFIESPVYDVELASYDRQWFGADVEHRMTLHDAALKDAFQTITGKASDAPPQFVMISRVTHGPIAGGFNLAKIESRFSVEYGGDVVFELPEPFVTTFDYGADSTTRFQLEQHTWPIEADGTEITWTNADLTVATADQFDVVTTSGTLGTVVVDASDGSASMGPVNVQGTQQFTEYGFWVGNVGIVFEAMNMQSPADGLDVSVGPTTIDINASVADELLATGGSFRIESIEIPQFATFNADLGLKIENLYAPAYMDLMTAVQRMNTVSDEEEIPPEVLDELLAAASPLISRGPSITYDPVDITIGDHTAAMSFSLQIPPEDERSSPALESLPLDMTVDMDLRLPSGFVETVSAIQPAFSLGVQQLLAQGLLVQDGSDYVMDAEYRAAALTVNGQAIPLPPMQ